MKVFVSCCSSKPEFSTIISILRMMDFADANGIKCELRPRLDESLICRARQRALGDFFYGDCTHMMTVDDDILFPADALYELAKADKDIIGGFYRLKTGDYDAVAQRYNFAESWMPIVEGKLVVPADYVATGCMLVSRETVVDMINHFPELEYKENLELRTLWALFQPFVFDNREFREYLSEDWAFCERARMAGREIWLHGGVQCKHWGKTIFTMEKKEDATRHSERHGDESREPTDGPTG